MAAVTVEDCLKVIPNRFELSLIASYRAKQLMNGAPMLYTSERAEKNTVVALREIAANLLDIAEIKEEIKNNIKNQALFKNFEDSAAAYSEKKDDDDLDISLNAVANEEDGKDDDLDDDLEEDDDDYYDNLNSEDVEDTFDEDLDK